MTAALAGFAVASAAAAGTPPQSRLAPCEVVAVEPGREASGWALLGGFESGAPAPRPFAWLREPAAAVLLLRGAGPRRLAVEARASRPRLRLAARLNGVDFGPLPVGRSWERLEWVVPQTALRNGPNLLELRPSKFRRRQGKRPVGVAVASIRIEAAVRCAIAAGAVAPPPSRGPTPMPPDSYLVSPLEGSRTGRLRVVFRGAWPATTLALHCVGRDGVAPIADLEAGRADGRRAIDFVDLSPACAAAAAVVVTAAGPGWSSLETLEPLPPRFWTWRRLLRLGLAAGVLAAAAVAVAAARRGVRLPLDRYAPWLDVAVIVSAALALRLLLLYHYPFPGFSGDEGDYLEGAKALAADPSLFWRDTSWHAWQNYFRPPGYYLFLAGVFGGGGGRMGVLLLQAVLSAVACGATYLMAWPLFGRGAALAAGGLFAVYVGSIATFTRILTEPLYMGLLLPALAALSWICKRPSVPIAALAGALFAGATLVRPAPVQFVPVAALLLLWIHRPRRSWRVAAAMVATMWLLLLPWYLRGARIHGHWIGLETISVANLLQFEPVERFVPAADLDLDDPAGFDAYYARLKRSNADGELVRRRGEVTRAVLAQKIRRPTATLSRFADNAADFFRPVPDAYLRWILSDHNAYRIGGLTALWNLQYLSIVGLGIIGAAATARQRRTWPLLVWYLFNFAVVCALVHPAVRYRFGIVPVLMVFAGWTLARGLAAVAERTPGDR